MNHYPLIGISGSIEHDESKLFIMRDYFTAILASGGIPLLLSPDMDAAQLTSCLEHIDGILLAGGGDVDPRLYGDTPIPALGQVSPLRDQFETKLLQASGLLELPVLGICRGMQVMNVFAGGTLYQDLQAQYSLDHSRPVMLHSQTVLGKYPSHEAQLEADSRFAEIFIPPELAESAESFASPAFPVNSFHHQAVRKLAPALRASAHSVDGLIEAVENPEHSFWIGVQWHPEKMHREDENAKKLFDAFVRAAAECAKGKGRATG